jgi:hypothetical protein
VSIVIGPAGFAASASGNSSRTVCSTLVVIPQSGQGTPVTIRKGHAKPG